jgi:hypothetical protein
MLIADYLLLDACRHLPKISMPQFPNHPLWPIPSHHINTHPHFIQIDLTFSEWHISCNLCIISLSVSFLNLNTAQRDWMGSMILLDWLQAKANLVVFENISIVLLRACCAPVVILSASSNITIFCLPGGNVTFFCANALILLLTTSMPLPYHIKYQQL